MATRNDITGDALVSKRNNDNYRDNFDRIFRKKNKDLTDGTLTDEGTKTEQPENEDGLDRTGL